MKHDKKPGFNGMYAGLFCKCVAFAFAAGVATMAYATDWYVDANNGNDAWDGTTAAIPDQATIEAGGTVAGPRKTLHAMMSASLRAIPFGRRRATIKKAARSTEREQRSTASK